MGAAWLAAMIEGEGYVSPPHQQQRRVTITNQNVFVLSATADILEALDVVFSFRKGTKDGAGSIAIYGKANFEKLWCHCGRFMVSWKKGNLEYLATKLGKHGGSKPCAENCSCRRHTWGAERRAVALV